MKSTGNRLRGTLHLRVTMLALGLSGLLGCATTGSHSSEPAWWADPQKHGSQYLFFKAKGESTRSLEAARQDAFRSIQSQIAQYVLAEVRVASATDNATSVESAVALREVESFREDEGREGGRYVVWMLGRYPRAEYDRIRERLKLGIELEEKWRKAQSAVNRQEYIAAEPILVDIVGTYDKALRTSFEVEAAKLKLAELYLKQNRGLKARQWIEDVINSATDPSGRKRALALKAQLPPVSLRDAFEGRRLVIVCQTLRDGKAAQGIPLNQELNTRLARESIATVMMPESAQTTPPVVDLAYIRLLAATAKTAGADALLLIRMDIDSSKTGRTFTVPGSDARSEMLDAKLTYWIVRAHDGHVLASDSTTGYSRNPVALLHTILTHRRHLPAHAPAIIEGLLND